MEKVQICRQNLNNPISRGSKLTALVGLILFTASLACSAVSVSLNSNPSVQRTSGWPRMMRRATV